MNKNKTRNIVIVVILLLIVLAALFFALRPKKEFASGVLDDFAKCLATKGATMYGAYWCPHCQNEKAAFGSSFRYVNYVECTQETDKCNAAGIQGFPTWIFSDGRRFEGEQGLNGLSSESGCPLPAQSSSTKN